MSIVKAPEIHGLQVDPQTRCAHWHGPSDILAIKFRCCNKYFSCYECHAALSDHLAQPWPAKEFSELAALCGACRNELTIQQYLDSNARCPNCSAAFNPHCALHHHLYFEMPASK